MIELESRIDEQEVTGKINHNLKFEDFMNVEFVEGVPEILDDILSFLCAVRYRNGQVDEDPQGLLLIDKECLRIKHENNITCTNAQLINLQIAFKRLSRNPSNNYAIMYLTQGSIMSNFVTILV